jgi:hypothetical protein
MCLLLHVKHPSFLSDLKETWIFWTDFREILNYQISWKSVQRELRCSMRTYGRTDRHDKANSRFSKFAIARKKSCMYVCMYYVCMYVCVYVCIHVCKYVRTYVCMNVCTYVCMYVYNGCNVGADRELHGFRVEPGCVLLTPIGKHVCFISGSEVCETGRDLKPLEKSKTIRKKSNWFWYVSIWLCRWCRFTQSKLETQRKYSQGKRKRSY